MNKFENKMICILIRALNDQDSQIRLKAALALGQTGDERVVDFLIEALSDENCSVKRAAVSALGELRDKNAIDTLIDAMKVKDFDAMEEAVEALGKIGDERAVESLIAALKDKDGRVRREAVRALDRIGDIRALMPLIEMLKDEDADIRREAAEILGDIGDKRAVNPLIEALEDRPRRVENAAAVALGKIGDKEAIKPLIAALRYDNDTIRETSALALEKLKWKPVNIIDKVWYYIAKGEVNQCAALGFDGVEPLIQTFKYMYLSRAEEALVKIRNLSVLPLIKSLKDENWRVRIGAATVLGKIGDKIAVQALIGVLKDKDISMQAAAEALGEIGDREAVCPLIGLLKIRYHYVRKSAAEALGKIGDKKAIKPLIAAMEDKDFFVREYAAEALEKFNWKPANNSEKVWYYMIKNKYDDMEKLGKKAVKPLVKALRNGDEDVRKEAAEILDELHWRPSNIDDQLWYYIAKKENDKCLVQGNKFIKPLRSLLRNGDVEVVGFALTTLEKLNWMPLNNFEKVLCYLAKEEFDKCVELGKDAVEPLIKALRYDEDFLQKAIAEVLGKIGDERAVEPLIEELKNEHYNVAEAAVKALGEIGDKRAVKPLQKALEKERDPDAKK